MTRYSDSSHDDEDDSDVETFDPGHGHSRHRRTRKSWRSIGRSNPRLKAPGRFEQLFIGLFIGAAIGFVTGWVVRPPRSTVLPPEPPAVNELERQRDQAVRERMALENIRTLNDATMQRNGSTTLEVEAGSSPTNTGTVLGLPATGPAGHPDDTRHPLRVKTGN
jgi:hypothetical protein